MSKVRVDMALRFGAPLAAIPFHHSFMHNSAQREVSTPLIPSELTKGPKPLGETAMYKEMIDRFHTLFAKRAKATIGPTALG
jgi:hypothetical protein